MEYSQVLRIQVNDEHSDNIKFKAQTFITVTLKQRETSTRIAI